MKERLLVFAALLGVVLFMGAATLINLATQVTGVLPSANDTIATSSARGGVIPRQNLIVDGSGNTDYTPLDWTVANIDEEFCGGGVESNAQFGQNGWTISTIVSGSGNFTTITPSMANPCVGGFRTDTTSTHGVQITFAGFTAALGNTSTTYLSGWIFAPFTAASTQIRVGYVKQNNSAAVPTDWFGICYDTKVGCGAGAQKTHYNLCSTVGSTETCYDTSVTPVASTFVHLDVRNISNIKLGMTLKDASGSVLISEKTFCASSCDVTATPTTTNSMSPGALAVTNTSSASGLYLDAFKMHITGLTR